ncbi:N-acetylglutamate synthase [Lentithecium fluviatile CBS 122367]|uniref:Amino-acid acetyltransferase, mitochondrial n=1 Tax=Lentithecium fluviatile CBS 122367 TaxID=1168545 RepID=A0A6G1J2Q0_9PLEO|nr:N-acetylglutamate synthase [Lentithecium fluviatile CBS 122367]
MFSCCRAQSRGLGRTAFSTAPPRNASGTDPTRNGRKSVAKERQRAERDQLTRLLKESPVKRDAKNFLKHFDTPTSEPAKVGQFAKEAVERAHHDEWRLTKTGVNLGNLYEPTKAVQESPVFMQQELPEKKKLQERASEPLHLALVKLRQPQALDNETLRGLALTLSQMARLGLNIAVVVDCDESENGALDSLEPEAAWETTVREQTSRIVDALEDYNEPGAFAVDHALCHSDVDTEIPSTRQVQGGVEVKNNRLLFPPIEDGIIPVIPPFAYSPELKKVRVHADHVVLALTREFAGITTQNLAGNGPQELDDALYNKSRSTRPVLDRIIILDPLGGIPSLDRADGAHVFINLEAEYHDIKTDLQPSSSPQSEQVSPILSSLAKSNPFPRFVETEIAPLPGSEMKQTSNSALPSRHVQNLNVVQQALRLLPPSSSALIITPGEAAISSQVALRGTPSTGVRTRRSKNPLIHNLLTDKPMISSSLPAPLVNRPRASAAPNPATFLKKGIPVTMIPDPRVTGPWRTPSTSNPSIELENDPRINFPRLIDLIEDSFRRKLDARHYLDRIRGRVAGVIIAGDYEGGAICTWETPLSLSASTLPRDSSLWVPYLDKFAVLTSSQGSGGVADIVWGALTRSAFPAGVVWRSRKNNPVNKWYFERSVGMWNLPDGYWTMFWTTEGVVEEYAQAARSSDDKHGISEMVPGNHMTRWDAYVSVCGGVKPSWKDTSKPD